MFELFYLLAIYIEEKGLPPNKDAEALLLEPATLARLADWARSLSSHVHAESIILRSLESLLSTIFRLFETHQIAGKGRRERLLSCVLEIAFLLPRGDREPWVLDLLDRALIPFMTDDDARLLPELIDELFLDLTLAGTPPPLLFRRRALILLRLLQPSLPFAAPLAHALSARVPGILEEMNSVQATAGSVLQAALAGAVAISCPADATLQYLGAFLARLAIDPTNPGGTATSEVCFAGLVDALVLRPVRRRAPRSPDGPGGVAAEVRLDEGEVQVQRARDDESVRVESEAAAVEQEFAAAAMPFVQAAAVNPTWPPAFQQMAQRAMAAMTGP